MNPYCDCGACCDACGRDADCASRDITPVPAGDYDHDAYTL